MRSSKYTPWQMTGIGPESHERAKRDECDPGESRDLSALAAAPGLSPCLAVLGVAGPWQLTAASNVAPDGHLRYSFGPSTYLYRFRGMMTAQPETFSIAKYLVQGLVKDDHGVPVEGAALPIGKPVVYSDSSGRFLVRSSKRGPFPLSVAPEEFITNGVYEAVSGRQK
jgi:hypothetical protein